MNNIGFPSRESGFKIQNKTGKKNIFNPSGYHKSDLGCINKNEVKHYSPPLKWKVVLYSHCVKTSGDIVML